MSQDKKSDEAKKAFLSSMLQVTNELVAVKEIIDRVNEQLYEYELKSKDAAAS